MSRSPRHLPPRILRPSWIRSSFPAVAAALVSGASVICHLATGEMGWTMLIPMSLPLLALAAPAASLREIHVLSKLALRQDLALTRIGAAELLRAEFTGPLKRRALAAAALSLGGLALNFGIALFSSVWPERDKLPEVAAVTAIAIVITTPWVILTSASPLRAFAKACKAQNEGRGSFPSVAVLFWWVAGFLLMCLLGFSGSGQIEAVVGLNLAGAVTCWFAVNAWNTHALDGYFEFERAEANDQSVRSADRSVR